MTFDSSNRPMVESMSTKSLIEDIEIAMGNGCIGPCHVFDYIDEALCRLAKAEGIERKPPYAPEHKAKATEGRGKSCGVVEPVRRGNLDASKSAPDELKADVERRVRRVVTEELGARPESITLESSFMDDLGADSLDCVELVMALEEEFGTCIPEGDLDGLLGGKDTVGRAVDYIYGKLYPEAAKEQPKP